jgi:hypothetical protein
MTRPRYKKSVIGFDFGAQSDFSSKITVLPFAQSARGGSQGQIKNERKEKPHELREVQVLRHRVAGSTRKRSSDDDTTTHSECQMLIGLE